MKLTYKRIIFAGIIITSLGVVFSNTLEPKSLGIVLIAVGGLFIISGISQKNKTT